MAFKHQKFLRPSHILGFSTFRVVLSVNRYSSVARILQPSFQLLTIDALRLLGRSQFLHTYKAVERFPFTTSFRWSISNSP